MKPKPTTRLAGPPAEPRTKPPTPGEVRERLVNSFATGVGGALSYEDLRAMRQRQAHESAALAKLREENEQLQADLARAKQDQREQGLAAHVEGRIRGCGLTRAEKRAIVDQILTEAREKGPSYRPDVTISIALHKQRKRQHEAREAAGKRPGPRPVAPVAALATMSPQEAAEERRLFAARLAKAGIFQPAGHGQ